MVGLYLFCLGLGGVLLAATFFTDADGPDHHLDTGWHQLLSLRNLTYFFFTFGAVGAGLTALRGGGTGLFEFIAAASTGIVTVAMVQSVFAYIRRTEGAEVASDMALVGQSAIVTVPIAGGNVGKVELSYGGQRVDLLARVFGSAGESDKPPEIERGTEVVIVEMTAGIALVSPAANDLRLT